MKLGIKETNKKKNQRKRRVVRKGGQTIKEYI